MLEKLQNFKKCVTDKKILSVIMAMIVYSFLCFTKVIVTYNLFSWLIFFTLIILFYKTDIYNKILKKEILILSILFSILAVYGNITYLFMHDQNLSILRIFFSYKSLLKIIGTFNIIYIILCNLIPVLYKYNMKKKKSVISKKWLIFIISFLIILIGWVPYFLNFYPGTLTPDSLAEMSIIINNFTNVSDHHPVLHILFISLPYNIAMGIFKDNNISVALVSIFQMVVMASIFSSFIVFLYKRRVHDIFLSIITLSYSLLPVFGYYSIVMWKDVVFSGILLLLTMETVRIVEIYKSNNLSFKKMIPFIIISILCVFFRNNAIYMYMFLFFTSLIIFRKKYKIFITSFLIVFIVYFGVKGPVFNYFNITKSASAEYIGMPLQQIGRMAFKNIEFTDQEEQLINKLIPVEIMRVAYNPVVSDGIKFNENYNGEVFDKNKIDYFKLWLRLVKKYPSIAIEAYSISTLGYWYPGVNYWSVAKIIWDNEFNIRMNSKLPIQFNEFLDTLESRETPILNIEWSIGLCFWIILIFGILSYKKHKLIGLYPYIPILGIWITMMVASPVFGEFRYVFGAFTCLPLFCLVPYLNLKIEKE